jgi:hypothetical protein
MCCAASAISCKKEKYAFGVPLVVARRFFWKEILLRCGRSFQNTEWKETVFNVNSVGQPTSTQSVVTVAVGAQLALFIWLWFDTDTRMNYARLVAIQSTTAWFCSFLVENACCVLKTETHTKWRHLVLRNIAG